MKQMLKKQMKGVPEAEQKKVFEAIEKNPDFFMNIAKEIEAKMKTGKDQQTAAIEVMMAHQDKLREIMGR
jgi:S-adenosylmethionine:tRNA-ribosyltransferase-isomerase (queuine synthetase)